MPSKYVTIAEAIVFIERAAKHKKVELSVDLKSLYNEETLSSYATREDVCELIYYALTGNTDGFDGEFGSSHGWARMTISYSIAEDNTLTLIRSDFSSALLNISKDETLSYIKFTSLPSAGGIFYYEYDKNDASNTRITKNTSYDPDDLSKITLVPVSGFEGTITVFFTAYTKESNSYTGKIVISVGNANITAGAITYTTDKNVAITFNGSDFRDACSSAAAGNFSYIKFTTLPTYYGVPYYDYDEDDVTHTEVTKNTSYDLSKISHITFVPRTNAAGTVSFSYVGYTLNGTEYTGTVKIIIKDTGITAATIVYSTGRDEAFTFRGFDFGTVCSNAAAGTFSYVKLTALPSSGVLYYNYDSNDDTNYTVLLNMSYDAGELSNITFVPKTNYSGSVSVSYTGYTTQGVAYTGTVQIIVG